MATLEELRDEIERIDGEIIDLIGRRQDCAGRVARLKYMGHLPVRNEGQRQAVLDRVFERAVERGVDATAVQQVFELLIGMSEARQRDCLGEGNLP
ncbi:MAG TPA: chorismate mutase [Methanoregulaceae archaeon]|nr:chorismate mutase [Methanoregulaceae archaeon]